MTPRTTPDGQDTPNGEAQPDEIQPDEAPPKGERIAKLIARAGVCSRREAERMIEAGQVRLDGEVIRTPAIVVDDPRRIAVDGKPLPAVEPTRLFRYHKTRGLLVAERDPEGRPTIYDGFPAELPRLMPVGRLDLASEGLLLLTNDGELKRSLELPSTGWLRRYRARVWGDIDEKKLAGLINGVTIEGIQYGSIEAKLDQVTGDNAWVTVALREGRNREVRRVMEHIGLKVNRLIRVAYGPFQLGAMVPGQISEVPPKVIAEQLGVAQPSERKIGTAKAKPRTTAGTGKGKARNANRRRPS